MRDDGREKRRKDRPPAGVLRRLAHQLRDQKSSKIRMTFRSVVSSTIILSCVILLVPLCITLIAAVRKVASIDNSTSEYDTSPTAFRVSMPTLSSSTSTRTGANSEGGTQKPKNIEDGSYYIFLQRFPLQHTGGWLFHTEVLVCPRHNFTLQDRHMLDRAVASMVRDSFLPLEESWWTSTVATPTYCVELGYGGSSCTTSCCSVPQGISQRSYPLHARYAIIQNADGSQKSLFLYGTGTINGVEAYHAVCNNGHTPNNPTPCWSRWSGTDYNPLFNNCNTFTSTVLSCVYGLSQKKPNLGPSDMVTVKCHCQPTLSISADSTEETGSLLHIK